MSNKPIRLKIKKPNPPDLISRKPNLRGKQVPEILTHQVQGQHASNLEEHLAKALEAHEIQYEFQYIHGAPKGLPGYNALDFLIYHGGVYYPTQVDDTTFIHKGTGAHDKVVDIKTMDDLNHLGLNPYPIRHVTQDDLSTYEDAERYVRNTFL